MTLSVNLLIKLLTHDLLGQCRSVTSPVIISFVFIMISFVVSAFIIVEAITHATSIAVEVSIITQS